MATMKHHIDVVAKFVNSTNLPPEPTYPLLKELNKYIEPTDFFEMANLSSRKTGLPFIVWVSPRGGAKHDVRVKITTSPQASADWEAVVALRPEIKIVSGTLSKIHFDALKNWLELNYDTIVAFWDGSIEYTEDMLDQIKRV
ncbi:MAG: hypothetical protein HC836_23375 [Richelia sp. RM2_1_2]|nr:hypothetical protein [Richelia sp. RM2_1_2]